MKILVTGGAGYIGSHACLKLKEKGYTPVIYDNLVYGHRESVPGCEMVQGDLGDAEKLAGVFEKHEFEAVMHFAAYAYVGESVENPSKYFRNNVADAVNLIDAMVARGVGKLIFSSTCAVYGVPLADFLDESHPLDPINPYGESKLFFERILGRYREAYGLRSVSLRYFNAAGADPKGRIGESHDPETHLIPLVLKTARGEREAISIYGNDYDTPDGTCIRDYVHVFDLADAHILALEALGSGRAGLCYNLGNGEGFSVREVIACAEEITGVKIATQVVGRRAGDPARLVADARLAEKELGWSPRFTTIDKIIETAWNWERNRKF